MIKTVKQGGMTHIVATEGILHRKGSADYPAIRRRPLLDGDSIDNYEELTADQIPAYTESEYEDLVGRKIAERYSINAQIALLRQAATKPDEFAAFDAFAEACKAEARKELAERKKEEE